ncbi:unnamed protein product [Parnassius mnemosyne]|uniref:Uncharacterized protein n=1 Tax=Parnassius mnemosyne TaxID=213953 RepID=A0AAV1L1A0_9NEOP
MKVVLHLRKQERNVLAVILKTKLIKNNVGKIFHNLCNLNKLPVSSEYDDVHVKIKCTKEEILESKTKILKQKLARQTKIIQDRSSLMATNKKYTGQSEIQNIYSRVLC